MNGAVAPIMWFTVAAVLVITKMISTVWLFIVILMSTSAIVIFELENETEE